METSKVQRNKTHPAFILLLIIIQIMMVLRMLFNLGVILDHSLIWTDHIHYVQNKIAKGLPIICKAN